MTLWSDFLRRLMLGASLSAPAAAAGAEDPAASQPPAEIGEAEPERSGHRAASDLAAGAG